MTHDYVIVGAGAAGCVLAHRLSADPQCTVLLVEDGGRGRDPLLEVPRAFYFTMRTGRHAKRYPVEATMAGAPSETWIRGRGLGGSTLVNGMMYVRGAGADFDALGVSGGPGWGGAAFARAYREMESGPLAVSVPTSGDGVTDALLESASSLGLRRVSDFNASDDERIGFTPATISGGRRVSAASAFLRPVMGRPNLTVLTRARAERLLLDGSRVRGVSVRRPGGLVEVSARREVLVAAGTIESPLLLERSGIGASSVLRRAGITLVHDSPNVGERVIEQRAVSMQVRFNRAIGPTERLNSVPKQAREAIRYLATRRGPIATSGYDVVSAFRSDPGLSRPDVQGVWVPMAIDETSQELRLARYSGLLFTGYTIRPTTTGSLHVVSADPRAMPLVTPRYLQDDEERRSTGAILDHARRVVAASPLAGLVDAEVFPGPSVSSASAVVEHARMHGSGIYHAVGSCAMGPDDEDVTDADLRVRGVDGLRVVDASVLPFQVSGNTAAPVMALAWLAAERILG
ncbi:MAG: GMC family oxidoreductase N-terminal domain-containing protein [Aeromicrobium sp.]|uniref:GMC family oxidoreductase n=1 Tax=Aeromicrobium sp. TaxID=1871063 RepID=UPI002605BD8E|nr:GMC family oxidoreductase N-terminal domain-containing protein [Aeromicrobium sp.]MDF1706139.1 GMC family oxidoreductase N-terminal domain-containing protein [Aeromicrobium sp.]